MKISTTTSLLLATALAASAAIRTETIEYKHGDVTLEGHLTYEDSFRGPRPGVLVVHQWKGLSDYEKQRSEMLARLGYVAFAVDIYGKGVRPQTVEAASAEASKYKNDRALLRARVTAGLEALRRHKLVDTKPIAAIGYCFGGTTVIELARSGAEVSGVVSFHGALDSPKPEDGKNIKCKVLALHGADDPFVPDKDVAAFVAEMRGAKVDWQLVQYGGAVHSFTDWKADGSIPGAKYDERADKRSWEDMKQFLAEIFK
ncbi:MAG: dienelactone hydrolase family protein [Verrucomicrobia bacterium]|nr:dienelactone hydrolase family protein [Verrucomicrobiota bacterium]